MDRICGSVLVQRSDAIVTFDVSDAWRYYSAVIKSFADKRTAAIFIGRNAKHMPADVAKRARAKLLMIDAAKSLTDLRVPPANRLEALSTDREGQHSIRVNDQWRLCFRWKNGDAYDVEFVDYHSG